MKKILILDFDGTVIDSNYIKIEAIKKYIKNKYKINILKYISLSEFQRLNRYQILSIAKNSSISDLEKFDIDEEINNKVKHAKIDPYLFKLYKFCSRNNIKIFLISNTPDDSLIKILKSMKISHLFYKIIGKKNNFEKGIIFSKVIKEELVNSNHILSVGDNINDYFASKENKIPFHGINNNSLNCLKTKFPISNSLLGIINSLR